MQSLENNIREFGGEAHWGVWRTTLGSLWERHIREFGEQHWRVWRGTLRSLERHIAEFGGRGTLGSLERHIGEFGREAHWGV